MAPKTAREVQATERRLLSKLIRHLEMLAMAAGDTPLLDQPAEMLNAEQRVERAVREGEVLGITLAMKYLQDVRDGKVTL